MINKKNLNDWSISEEMLQWLLENLDKGKTILEFGSGYGTIELTKFWNVYSVEQNKGFVGLAPDSNYTHAPIVNGWYDVNLVFDNIPKEYDLLIVDGPAGTGNREGIESYWDRLNLNVPILMDDTHRIKELTFAQTTSKKLNKELTIIPGHQKSFGLLL
jgi:hypothetical protein